VDFNELKPLILDAGPSKPSIFDDAQYPLPESQELIAAGWPVRKERLSRAILALSLRNGALDLADGGSVTRTNIGKREYHHLFPVAHLTRLGLADEEIYRALNCALVTWRTNRNISDKNPERYLAERREGTSLGDPEVKARLATHLIPHDDMVKGDYAAFLTTRAQMMCEAMTRLCEGGGS
jgi:hypothetical protein